MKYAIVIPDGCSDVPLDALGGRTPLEAANIPNMHAVVQAGLVARTDNVPRHLPAGSEVANLTLLGYDPNRFFTGRAPIEAAAQGITLGSDDWAVRCNLVTVTDGRMASFTAGQIPSETGRQLIEIMQHACCGDEHWKFYAGVSYRNLLIYRTRGGRAPFA